MHPLNIACGTNRQFHLPWTAPALRLRGTSGLESYLGHRQKHQATSTGNPAKHSVFIRATTKVHVVNELLSVWIMTQATLPVTNVTTRGSLACDKCYNKRKSTHGYSNFWPKLYSLLASAWTGQLEQLKKQKTKKQTTIIIRGHFYGVLFLAKSKA